MTPYWFAEHPTLTFTDYYNDTNYGASLLRTFAISVATAPIDASDVTKGTQLALGMRAMIVPGHANAALEELRQRLAGYSTGRRIAGHGGGLDAPLQHERARIAAKLEAATGAAARAGWQARLKAVDDKIEQRKAAIARTTKATAQEIAERQAAAKKLTARISDLDAQRDGFMLTVAEGQAWAFANDVTSAGQLFTRASVWITPAYRIRPCDVAKDDGSLRLRIVDRLGWRAPLHVRPHRARRYVAMGRRWAHRVASQQTTGAVGGGSAAQQRSAFVHGPRIRRIAPWASSSTASPDGTLFFASFGKDFDNGTDHKTLVTLMGLNFGLGQKPVIDLSK